MTLYNDFASHYDHIFPANETTVSFLRSSFKPGRILDLGSATGNYALALSESDDFQVEGIDLDSRMVAIARIKAIQQGRSTKFAVGDIADLSASGIYQGIYSIGNTVVHLPSTEAIVDLFKRIHEALVPGGSAIIQIVNYDRILDQSITSLPTIERNGRSFTREYTILGDTVIFRTRLTYGSENFAANTKLIALRSDDLRQFATEAGFADHECFGGFDKTEFAAQTSYSLIIRARKQLRR